MYGDEESSEGGPKSSFEIYKAEGDVLYKQGEYTKALDSYNLALEIRPDENSCLVARSQCYLQLGNSQAALHDAEATLKSNANNINGLYQKAEALYQKGDFEFALVFYHRGYKLRPEKQEFRKGIQKAQEAIDNSVGDTANIKLEKKGDLSDFYRPEENKKQKQQKQGYSKPGNKKEKQEDKCRKRQTGQDQKTIKQLLGELYDDREYLEKLLNETEDGIESKTNQEIANLCENTLEYLDKRTDFWRQQKPLYARGKGSRRGKSGRDKKGVQGGTQYYLDKLEEIDNDQAEGKHNESLKKANKCLKEVEGLSDEDLPNRAEIVANLHSCIGNAYLEKGDLNKALEHHQIDNEIATQNELDDAKSRSMDNIGRVYARMGKFDKAVEIWEQKLPLSKSSLERTWLYHEIGRCYLEIGKYEDARDYGEKSLAAAEEAKDDVWQLNASVLMAQSEVKLGDLQAALEAFEKSLDMAKVQGDGAAEQAIKRAIDDVNQKIVKGLKEGEGESEQKDKDEDTERESEKEEENQEVSQQQQAEQTYEDDFEPEEQKDEVQGTKYSVVVYTADKMFAGTDANVHIELKGDQADSGKMPLSNPKSKAKDKLFEAGSVDEFELSCESLGKVKQVTISHDGTGAGDGWFLDKIIVQETGKFDSKTTFNCDRWLDSNEDDGKIERTLEAEEPVGQEKEETTEAPVSQQTEADEKVTYVVTVYTGDEMGAGTDANVCINIVGEDGETGTQPLTTAKKISKDKLFENGSVDEFDITCNSLGKLQKLKIWHDAEGFGAGWFLDKVEVELDSTKVTFECHKWLDKDEDDGAIERELFPESAIITGSKTVHGKSPHRRRDSEVPQEGSKAVLPLNRESEDLQVEVLSGDESGMADSGPGYHRLSDAGHTQETVLENVASDTSQVSESSPEKIQSGVSEAIQVVSSEAAPSVDTPITLVAAAAVDEKESQKDHSLTEKESSKEAISTDDSPTGDAPTIIEEPEQAVPVDKQESPSDHFPTKKKNSAEAFTTEEDSTKGDTPAVMEGDKELKSAHFGIKSTEGEGSPISDKPVVDTDTSGKVTGTGSSPEQIDEPGGVDEVQAYTGQAVSPVNQSSGSETPESGGETIKKESSVKSTDHKQGPDATGNVTPPETPTASGKMESGEGKAAGEGESTSASFGTKSPAAGASLATYPFAISQQVSLLGSDDERQSSGGALQEEHKEQTHEGQTKTSSSLNGESSKQAVDSESGKHTELLASPEKAESESAIDNAQDGVEGVQISTISDNPSEQSKEIMESPEKHDMDRNLVKEGEDSLTQNIVHEELGEASPITTEAAQETNELSPDAGSAMEPPTDQVNTTADSQEVENVTICPAHESVKTPSPDAVDLLADSSAEVPVADTEATDDQLAQKFVTASNMQDTGSDPKDGHVTFFTASDTGSDLMTSGTARNTEGDPTTLGSPTLEAAGTGQASPQKPDVTAPVSSQERVKVSHRSSPVDEVEEAKVISDKSLQDNAGDQRPDPSAEPSVADVEAVDATEATEETRRDRKKADQDTDHQNIPAPAEQTSGDQVTDEGDESLNLYGQASDTDLPEADRPGAEDITAVKQESESTNNTLSAPETVPTGEQIASDVPFSEKHHAHAELQSNKQDVEAEVIQQNSAPGNSQESRLQDKTEKLTKSVTGEADVPHPSGQPSSFGRSQSIDGKEKIGTQFPAVEEEKDKNKMRRPKSS